MKVRVQYMAQLRTVIGAGEEEVEVPASCCLVELLQHLADRHGPHARSQLLASGGQLQSGLLVVVNGTAMTASHIPSAVLRENDTVMLMPPISGG